MTKTMELIDQKLGVNELRALRESKETIYAALRYYSMSRGFSDMWRLAKRIKGGAKISGYILDGSLDSKQNRELVNMICRMAGSVNTALDMYEMFHQCDSDCDKEG